MSETEVYNGLAFAAAAFALLGKAGVWLTLIICFMAITSSGAGELVATSSLFTFDFWRKYINPKVGYRVTSRVLTLQWRVSKASNNEWSDGSIVPALSACVTA